MTGEQFDQKKLPQFTQINPATIVPQLEKHLTHHRNTLKKLLAQDTPYTWANLMQPMAMMHDELHHFWAPIGHLHGVLETEALREAYNAALPLMTAYYTELSQNEALYQAIAAIAASPDFKQLSADKRKIIENELRDFKLAGIHLPADKKARMAALQQQMSQLVTKFSENLLDATGAFTYHTEDIKALSGLPEQALQLAIDNAKRRNLPGYVITLDFPSYSTAMRFIANRPLRQKLYEAYTTRASDQGPHAGRYDNTAIMDDILRVRHEMAQLVGFDNFATYSLATKMAKTPEEVLSFLQQLVQKSRAMAKHEYAEVVAFAHDTDQIDDFSAWDLAYYAEKLGEKKFHFSPEELRPYFPIDKVLAGMFSLVHKLYGITIREQTDVDIWHPDVRFFAIYDAKNNLRAGFYTDLYARPHKRDGAWMDDCRTRHVLPNGQVELPVAFLTCNFMPPVGDQPALLTHDDVVTVFHEFGHCLHHMLTKVDEAAVAGINGVPWDAVELPSQFMENFCWEKASLDMIAQHYQTHEPLPDDLYQKMLAAKHYQTGLQMVRQLEFSLFDFRMHLEFDPNKLSNAPAGSYVYATLNDVRKQTAVAKAPDWNRFPNSFSHVFAGGYAAGYYSYKWAEVLSADAYAQFEEHGIFDAKTGRAFLENILEVGGVRDPMDAFIAFRGRKPSIDALLRHNGITEESPQ